MTSPNENYTSWHCGMKVVCVGDFEGRLTFEQVPEVNGVYTIRAIEAGADNEVYLLLDEIRNSVFTYREGPSELSFWAADFRPVQTRKTDISIFQRILSNPHKKIHKVEGERV